MNRRSRRGLRVRQRWSPVRLAPLFLVAAAALVPWSIYLSRTLPTQHEAAHWGIAWVGFDLALASALSLVGITAARRSPWLEGAATAAATLLFVDAWFDVLTAGMASELKVAGLEAAGVEIPMAVVCLWLARSAKRTIDKTEAAPGEEPHRSPGKGQVVELVPTGSRTRTPERDSHASSMDIAARGYRRTA